MANNTMFTKKYVAEYNTSQDTLRQLATMEWNLDNMFASIYTNGVNTLDLNGIETLYHYLVYVYADRLWSFSWSILQKNEDEKEPTFEKFENEIKGMYEDWKKNNKDKVPTGLVMKLREYKRWLYEVKRKKLKLGIPTRTETTAHERMEKAAGV